MSPARRLLPLLTATACLAAAARADVTPTAQDFAARGRNLAAVTAERPALDKTPDFDFLLATLVKTAPAERLPEAEAHLYPALDPVPLASYKVYKPWLGFFRQSVLFVLGRLDAERLRLVRWQVVLRDGEGAEVRRFGGAGAPPAAFAWNGRDRKNLPVAVGRRYLPELIVEDAYGARVSLPQPPLVLDRFLWEERSRLVAAAAPDLLFTAGGAELSDRGGGALQELSLLVEQFGARLIEVECTGPDPALQADRARTLQTHLARENLGVKTIRVKTGAGPASVRVQAWRAPNEAR